MYYRLQDLTWEQVRDLAGPATVAVLPLGAIEQHGPHLPLDVDSQLASAIAEQAAQQAGRSVDVILVPCQHYGASQHHAGFPGTMSISLLTYIQVLFDLTESLITGGLRHIFFLNGHGGNGNPMGVAIRMLRERHKDIVVAGAAYWDIGRSEIAGRRRSEPGGMSHGGELETSMMLYLRPDAVNMNRAKRAVPVWCSPYLVEDLVAGTSGVSLGYYTEDVSATGVVGDPLAASASAGKAFFEAIGESVAKLLIDFSSWRMDALVKTV